MAKTELKAAYRAQNGLTGCTGPLMCALDSVDPGIWPWPRMDHFLGDPKNGIHYGIVGMSWIYMIYIYIAKGNEVTV